MGIRQAAALQDAFFRRRRIVIRTDLRRSHMELAQPDWGIGWVEGHAGIVQHRKGKTKLVWLGQPVRLLRLRNKEERQPGADGEW